jgi:type II secretory pathway component GspD/PulD (secretin)
MNRGMNPLRHGRGERVLRLVRTVGVACLAGALLAACGGAGRSYGRGDKAARNGDWDAAVGFYRRAVQSKPNRSDYRIALERAMINASSVHMDQGRVFEALTQLDEALREYRRANEFNPTSRVIASKVQELERRVREQLEAAQPKPSIQQMRERARQDGTPALLNLTMKLPLIRFTNASVRDILNFVGTSTTLNVTYDRDFQDRAYTVQLDNVTLEEALTQILSANQYLYKVVNDHTITVVPDTPQKRAQYEEQVIRTFYVSHADATELAQLLTTMIRLPNMAVQPRIVANKTANTITVGATANLAAIIEKIIESNDKTRAEVVVDVQILEINRSRAKQFGLDLSTYAIGGVFSPESDPHAPSGDAQADAGAAAAASSSNLQFNLNSISRGVNTGDFYLTVPSAVVRFLENDTETKLIAKPQLDVIGPGQANFSVSGLATVPGGGAAVLQFVPAPVSAR